MVNLIDLTDKEKTFLKSMVDVGGITPNLGTQKVAEYKDRYGCDPCDACGPDACAECKACIESYASLGQVNPFSKISR